MDAHPITVHLPIALVLLWPVIDLVGFLARRRDFSLVALALLGLALVSSMVATITGQAAFDAAVALGHAPERLQTHAEPANLVPWFLLVALALRGWAAVKFGRTGHFAGLMFGFLLWPFIWSVGASGGALVFEDGVGVVRSGDAPSTR